MNITSINKYLLIIFLSKNIIIHSARPHVFIYKHDIKLANVLNFVFIARAVRVINSLYINCERVFKYIFNLNVTSFSAV